MMLIVQVLAAKLTPSQRFFFELLHIAVTGTISAHLS